MVRVKKGVNAHRKHKKTLDLAKGYWMTRHKHFRKAEEAVLHAGEYAFAGRRLKRRDLRELWIIRMNAALRNVGTTYSKFINALKKKNISLDRKVLAQIAVEYPQSFSKIVEQVK